MMARHYLPFWVQNYKREWLTGDLGASVIVALLLIPQGLAYAQLAGMPPMAGLYASLGPLLIYGIFGTSMPQSVGPMAVTSAMTATALAPFAAAGSAQYLLLAATLTLLSGLVLAAFGALKLGQLTRLLSVPVIQGFSAGTALLIALGQLGALLGTQWRGDTLLGLAQSLNAALAHIELIPALFGLVGLLLMWLAGAPLSALLSQRQVPARRIQLCSKILPLLVMLALSIALALLDHQQRIATLGHLPSAQLHWQTLSFDPQWLQSLLIPATLIGIAGFLQSITVAQTIASQRHEKIDANRELLALGSCNVAAAAFGGMPVSGGFSRTAVNAAAGANTPLSGIFTAAWIALALYLFLPALAYLPQALLAATIILAVSRMISVAQLLKVWRFDVRDGWAWLLTFGGVLLIGPMRGITLGVAITIVFYLWRSNQPNIAIVGRLPGSEHFRNVLRYKVETAPGILAVRVDENLYFANIANVIAQIRQQLAAHPDTSKLLLIFSAINSIDYSAVSALKGWQAELAAEGIAIYLAEVKGPVLDTLQHGDFLPDLPCPPFLSTHLAMQALAPATPDYSI